MTMPTDEEHYEGSPYCPTGNGGSLVLVNQDEEAIQEASYLTGFQVRAEGMQEPGRH